MTRLRPKNWTDLQHYKRRSPPWVKLHKRLLDDFEFQNLPLASKALAPMLWLLASEDGQGWIDAQAAKISFRLRISEEELEAAIRPLLAAGFFEEEDASAALATDANDAAPESEEEKESETKPSSDFPEGKSDPRDDFDLFWKEYPTDALMSKKRALEQWQKLAPPEREAARAAVPAFREYCRKHAAYRPVHAERFLSERRFEGFAGEARLSPAEIEANKDRADRLMRRGKYAVNYQ
jgi:hypothetical protein